MSDLHLLDPVAQAEPVPRYGRLAILISALVVLVAMVVWAWLFLMQDSREDARAEAALGQSAHAAGDCTSAVPRLKAARNLGGGEFGEAPVDRERLAAEIAACEELDRARHAVATGNFPRAIDSFDTYLASAGARYTAAADEQSGVRVTYGRELEQQGNDRRAVTQYAAVLAATPHSEPAERAEQRIWALFEQDVEAGRRDEPCATIRPAEAWSGLAGRAMRPVREAAHTALSWSLLRCGEERIAEGERRARDARFDAGLFGAARYALLEAVQRYPDTEPGELAAARLERLSETRSAAQATAARIARERAETARISKQVRGAMASGAALERPDRYAGAGGEVRITIRNSTGRPLYVAWTGRDIDSLTVPAGSRRCGKALAVTLTLPPGMIALAVHDGRGWSAGRWSFTSDAYRTCVR